MTSFDTGLGPSFCTVDSTGRWVYVGDNSFRPVPAWATIYATILKLDTLSTPASPSVLEIAGGISGNCDFDGPATGAGYVCLENIKSLELDATERYLYFIDANNGYVRVLDLQANTITRVAGSLYGGLFNALQDGIVHFPPAPALGSVTDSMAHLAS